MFMFLIEQLPKDSTDAADPEAPLDRVTDLENRILDSMRQQLRGRKDPATPLDLRNATLGWAGSRSRANIPFVTQSDVTAGTGLRGRK